MCSEQSAHFDMDEPSAWRKRFTDLDANRNDWEGKSFAYECGFLGIFVTCLSVCLPDAVKTGTVRQE